MDEFQNRLQEWFWGVINRILKYKFLILFSISILIICAAAWCLFIHLAKGYIWADWTGFGEYKGTVEKDYRGKTLWDWGELLIIPSFLAFGAWWITSQEKKREIEISEERQREYILRDYLDKMADLLLKERLLENQDVDKTLVNVAQVRTVTALRSLDTTRQNLLIQFLFDSNLMDFILKDASLYSSHLEHIYLENAHLEKADLEYAHLEKAFLMDAFLEGANLNYAHLEGVDLNGAHLEKTDLMDTHLEWAILNSAHLEGAKLYGAHLEMASLWHAHLEEAILSGAHLEGADLRRAFITDEQLSSAKLSKDTIMPDGSKYNGRFDIKPDEP